MKGKKAAALLAVLLILASLLYTGCSTKAGGAQVQSLSNSGDSLIVIDSSGNALPIVFSFSREANGVRYYLIDGKQQTKEEISIGLGPGITVEEVSGIWSTSIGDLFAVFTPEQLYERTSRGAATNAALLYDMWRCLITGPSSIRENPRGILEGLVPNEDMRPVVFDYLEQRKQASFSQ